MTKNLTLNIEDLEDRIAPGLTLPVTEAVIFEGFMLNNGEFHPAGPFGDGPGQGFPGPWNATNAMNFGGPLEFAP